MGKRCLTVLGGAAPQEKPTLSLIQHVIENASAEQYLLLLSSNGGYNVSVPQGELYVTAGGEPIGVVP